MAVPRVLANGRMPLSKNMAYELVRAKKIRCVKVGNRYRIPKSEIVRFLDGKNC